MYKRTCINCKKKFNTPHVSHKRCRTCYNKWKNRTKKKRRKNAYKQQKRYEDYTNASVDFQRSRSKRRKKKGRKLKDIVSW